MLILTALILLGLMVTSLIIFPWDDIKRPWITFRVVLSVVLMSWAFDILWELIFG